MLIFYGLKILYDKNIYVLIHFYEKLIFNLKINMKYLQRVLSSVFIIAIYNNNINSTFVYFLEIQENIVWVDYSMWTYDYLNKENLFWIKLNRNL